jgi:hypothetical protein
VDHDVVADVDLVGHVGQADLTADTAEVDRAHREASVVTKVHDLRRDTEAHEILLQSLMRAAATTACP